MISIESLGGGVTISMSNNICASATPSGHSLQLFMQWIGVDFTEKNTCDHVESKPRVD